MKNEKQPKHLYKCPLCRDTGFIQGEKGYRSCKCMEMEKIQRMWKHSGISVNDLDKSFKNFEVWNKKSEELKNKGIKYYTNFESIKGDRRNSILLCGNCGSGKTHIALALANNFINKKNICVVYMPYRDIITRLKQNITDEEYYQRTLSKYQTAEILLIDDLFKGKVNESDINIMFELINYRYLNHLPMIISTEFVLDKMLSFDEAIGSRIYEMSKNYIVQVIGTENNYRMR